MNIFYVDSDPVVAAEMMCDKHVVKMILESAQILSTAHRVLDGDERADIDGLYKTAHKNHPSTVWYKCNPNSASRADCVSAYRGYYLGVKMYMATWKFTEAPAWTCA